jgi:hypothetical protein
MAIKVLVTRDVAKDEEHNYSGRTVNAGEMLYLFRLCTYNCIDTVNGIALSEKPDEHPFFEFPNDAIEAVE